MIGSFSFHDTCARLDCAFDDLNLQSHNFYRAFIHEHMHFSQLINTSVGFELFIAYECLSNLIYERLAILASFNHVAKEIAKSFSLNIEDQPIKAPLKKHLNLKHFESINNALNNMSDQFGLDSITSIIDDLETKLAENAKEIKYIDKWISNYKGSMKKSIFEDFRRILEDNLPENGGDTIQERFLKYLLDPDTAQIIFLDKENLGFLLCFPPKSGIQSKTVSIPITVHMLLEVQALSGDVIEAVPVLIKDKFDTGGEYFKLNPDAILAYKDFPMVEEGLIYSLPYLWLIQAHKNECPNIWQNSLSKNIEISLAWGLCGIMFLLIHIALNDELSPPLLTIESTFGEKLLLSKVSRTKENSNQKGFRARQRFILLLENIDLFTKPFFQAYGNRKLVKNYEVLLDFIRLLENRLKPFETFHDLFSKNISSDDWAASIDSCDKKNFSRLKFNLVVFIAKEAIMFRKEWNCQKASSDSVRYTPNISKLLHELKILPMVALDEGCIQGITVPGMSEVEDKFDEYREEYYHAVVIRHYLKNLFTGNDLLCFDRNTLNGRLHHCSLSQNCLEKGECVNPIYRNLIENFLINQPQTIINFENQSIEPGYSYFYI